jgi:hypothetical protein
MAGENLTGSSGIGTSGSGLDDVSRGADRPDDVSRGGADGLSRSAGSSVLGTSGVAGTDIYRDDEPHGVKAAAHELKDRARESSRDLLDQAVEKKDELKARATTAVDDGRHRAADRVGTLARALHDTADNLGSQGDQQLSGWVHQAADQVERMVGYLNGHDAGGLVRDMEDLARRNPALFLGGTYAAGLVLGRFLRASSPERRNERSFHDESQAAGDRTGAGVSPDSFAEGHTSGGRTDDSLRHGQDLGGTPGYGASSGMGAGLTDEDLRTAWHERERRRDDEGMRGASRTGRPEAEDRLDTGDLTSYTNGDRDREV